MAKSPSIRWTTTSLLLALAACHPDHWCNHHRGPAAAATNVVYRFRIAEQEVGHEEVALVEGGWRSKGRFDILGIAKGEYEVSLLRDGEVVRGDFLWDDGKAKTHIESEKRGTTFTARLLPDGKPVSVEGPADGVFFDNLVWAYCVDWGRALVAQGPSIASDFALKAFSPVSGAFVPVRLLEFERGETWAYTLQLAAVEMILMCGDDGVPVRILVPSQSVDIVREGFEKVEPPATKPTSIVDGGPWRRKLSKPKHEVETERKVMIPMRDGVRLAAEIHRPKAEGKFPAILIRTPYGRVLQAGTEAPYYARRGYAVVTQDCRGRGDSEGAWFPLRDEEFDGFDTIEWLTKQPWCDGKVGMLGASYVGWVQWYAAKSGHPALKAIVPQVAPPDPLENIPYEGGVFMLTTAWWAKMLEMMGTGEARPEWTKALATLPLNDLDAALGIKHPFLDEWIAHPPDDEAYWAPLSYQRHWAKLDVAALNISGWFDGDQPGAPQNFIGMRRAGKKDQYLLMGPWSHAFNYSRRLGAFDFGKEGKIDLDSVILRFFDRYLKGVENGIDAEDPVAIFIMGQNTWRREKDWPLPATKWTKLYLDGGKANRRDGGGRLSLSPGTGEDVYTFDPMKLPPTSADFDDLTGEGALSDQSKLEDVEEILDYTSPPAAEAVEITGPLSAVVSIASTAEDTDVVAEIFALTPEGQQIPIMGGMQRVRYRRGKDEPVKPGEVAEVTVDMWATSGRLEKGWRLRLQVSSSPWPGGARNLGTLEPQGTATKAAVATNRVLHNEAHASYLLLPVIGDLKFQ